MPSLFNITGRQDQPQMALFHQRLVSSSSLPHRPRSWLRLTIRICLLLLLGLGFFLSVFPLGRASVRAALLLPALLSSSTSFPLAISGEPIKHTQLTAPSRSGTVFMDVFTPTTRPPLLTGAYGGMLIIPGVGDNRQVPQLLNLSEALAQTGITVMDMTTPTLINYDLSALDSDAAVVAFQKLAAWPNVSAQHIGILSLSGGVLPGTLAAADPRIRNQVAYVANFGGYFDTTNLLRAFGRRWIMIDGRREPWKPGPVSLQVLSNVLTDSLSLNENALIKQATGDSIPLTADEIAFLSPPAQATYHLLMGDQPTRVEANIAALPLAVQAELINLSPAKVIAQIRAPIFLLHDRHDDSVPVTESRDFAAALVRLRHPYNYVEFDIFDHVLVRSNLNLWQLTSDGSRLFAVLLQIIQLSSS